MQSSTDDLSRLLHKAYFWNGFGLLHPVLSAGLKLIVARLLLTIVFLSVTIATMYMCMYMDKLDPTHGQKQPANLL